MTIELSNTQDKNGDKGQLNVIISIYSLALTQSKNTFCCYRVHAYNDK